MRQDMTSLCDNDAKIALPGIQSACSSPLINTDATRSRIMVDNAAGKFDFNCLSIPFVYQFPLFIVIHIIWKKNS